MCGKSACTVRRGEGPKPIGPSYPYRSVSFPLAVGSVCRSIAVCCPSCRWSMAPSTASSRRSAAAGCPCRGGGFSSAGAGIAPCPWDGFVSGGSSRRGRERSGCSRSNRSSPHRFPGRDSARTRQAAPPRPLRVQAGWASRRRWLLYPRLDSARPRSGPAPPARW